LPIASIHDLGFRKQYSISCCVVGIFEMKQLFFFPSIMSWQLLLTPPWF